MEMDISERAQEGNVRVYKKDFKYYEENQEGYGVTRAVGTGGTLAELARKALNQDLSDKKEPV